MRILRESSKWVEKFRSVRSKSEKIMRIALHRNDNSRKNYDNFFDRTNPSKISEGKKNVITINKAYNILLPKAIKVGVNVSSNEELFILKLCEALGFDKDKAYRLYFYDRALGFIGNFKEWLIFEFQVIEYMNILNKNRYELRNGYFIAKVNGYQEDFKTYLEEQIISYTLKRSI